jgi:hypothetical protein
MKEYSVMKKAGFNTNLRKHPNKKGEDCQVSGEMVPFGFGWSSRISRHSCVATPAGMLSVAFPDM